MQRRRRSEIRVSPVGCHALSYYMQARA